MKVPNLLPTPWRLRLLGVYAVTLLAAVAVVVFGVQPVVSEQPRADAGAETPRFVSSGQVLADQAVAAFADSAADTAAALTPAQRRSGLPTEPVEGLTSQTPAGPVQMVLPSGLGAAEHTAGGQVVYPDNGAGFDFLAENTSTGTRTVARISNPSGVRMVTTFVRTPAGTVMLAHTNGHLTINRATPAAETVGMFSPAETRDAAGNLVPSSYVVRQVAPQLYQLSEVIDPGPTTEWPVFVDPPLHLAGAGGTPLPQFDLSISGITDAVGSGLETLGNAASTVAEATVSAATSVGTFVKENPLESAMLVGGVALALTGVGGPASAAMIATASVNIASAGVDIAAAAMPDNEALGIASTTLGIASAFTPQGAAKQVVEEGVEQLVKHTDDIIDVAKAAPTPPAQLSQQVSGTASPSVPGSPPGTTPKVPNAPPGTAADTPVTAPPFSQALKDQVYAEARAAHPSGNQTCTYCGSRIYVQDGPTLKGDSVPSNRAQMDHAMPRAHGGQSTRDNARPSCASCNSQKATCSPTSSKPRSHASSTAHRIGTRTTCGNMAPSLTGCGRHPTTAKQTILSNRYGGHPHRPSSA